MGKAATSNFDRVVEVEHYAWCPACGEEPKEGLSSDSLRSWAIWHIASNPPGHEVRVVNHTVRLYTAETVSPEQMEREVVKRQRQYRRSTKAA